MAHTSRYTSRSLALRPRSGLIINHARSQPLADKTRKILPSSGQSTPAPAAPAAPALTLIEKQPSRRGSYGASLQPRPASYDVIATEGAGVATPFYPAPNLIDATRLPRDDEYDNDWFNTPDGHDHVAGNWRDIEIEQNIRDCPL